MGEGAARGELRLRPAAADGGRTLRVQAGREGDRRAAWQVPQLHAEDLRRRGGQQLPHSHQRLAREGEPVLGRWRERAVALLPPVPRGSNEIWPRAELLFRADDQRVQAVPGGEL